MRRDTVCHLVMLFQSSEAAWRLDYIDLKVNDDEICKDEKEWDGWVRKGGYRSSDIGQVVMGKP